MKEVGLCAASTTGVVRRRGVAAHVDCGSSLILAHFRLPCGVMKTEMSQEKT